MKLSRRIIWSVISIMVLVIGVFIVIVYMDDDETNPSSAENNAGETTKENSEPEKDTNKKEKTSTLDPFNQKYKQEELTDTHFRNYLHKMSHQKVIAEDKWGFYKITDERIAWLLESLETDDVKKRLTDGDIYLDILTRWEKSDFSQVDEDHNVIWRLQGGTVGKATGIFTEEEEETYIKNNTESE